MTVQRAAGYTRNFLVIDDGLAVLNNRNRASHQRDVEGLPNVGFARQFRRRRQESIYCAGVMAGRFLIGVGFNLHFVAAAQINSAVGLFPAVESTCSLSLRIWNH